MFHFFSDKITHIRSCFPPSFKFLHDDMASPPSFTSFSPVTEDDVLKIIKELPTKPCSLDPWPPFLLKNVLTLPIIKSIILLVWLCR